MKFEGFNQEPSQDAEGAVTKAEREPVTPEAIEASIERAKELYSELVSHDGIEVFGTEAIPKKHELEALSGELKETLKSVPANQCAEHGLPFHPMDEKYPVARAEFPDSPDYPLSYTPQPSEDGSGVDAEQPTN